MDQGLWLNWAAVFGDGNPILAVLPSLSDSVRPSPPYPAGTIRPESPPLPSLSLSLARALSFSCAHTPPGKSLVQPTARATARFCRCELWLHCWPQGVVALLQLIVLLLPADLKDEEDEEAQ